MSVEDRYDLIERKHGAAIKRALHGELQAVLGTNAAPHRKSIRIHQVADKIAALVEPHTICKKGCANCCYIANVISERDAKNIEAVTGRKRAKVEYTPPSSMKQKEVVAKFNGARCPFLGAKNDCTIYEARPLACRAHHSLEDSADPCYSQDGVTRRVGQFDLILIHMAEVEVLWQEPFADIREWFP